MGALMGGSVGACIGLLFGSMAVMRYLCELFGGMLKFKRRHGHGGAGFVPVVGKMVMQSAGSFGLFMGIGGLVRCDDVPVPRK